MNVARFFAFVLAGILSAASAARSQDYPVRPVTVIVPVAPGGSVDIVARLLGQKLTERLGKPVVVENRPGASTLIGTSAVAKAAPDGYTLLHVPSGTLAINPTLYKKLPYDPVKDFTPVARVVTVSFVLVVNPQLPAQSVLELVELAKRNPGKLLYASSGAGSAPHLSAELFKTLAGIEITHVSYKGGAPGLNDVIAGHVSLMFADPGPVVPHIRTARVRALGVSSPTRLPGLLDVPPIAEAGVPGFELVSWQMTAAPAGTPKEIVNKLNSELSATMASSEVRERLEKIGLIAAVSPPPEDLNRFLGSEIARWGKLVNQAGLAGSE